LLEEEICSNLRKKSCKCSEENPKKRFWIRSSASNLSVTGEEDIAAWDPLFLEK
jgi:hypothetical protein